MSQLRLNSGGAKQDMQKSNIGRNSRIWGNVLFNFFLYTNLNINFILKIYTNLGKKFTANLIYVNWDKNTENFIYLGKLNKVQQRLF